MLTDKWILGKKLRIPTIQLTDHMKPKKKEDQNVNASVLLRRRKNILTGGIGREGSGSERGKESKKGGRIRFQKRQERRKEGQENK